MLVSSVSECGILSLEWCVVVFLKEMTQVIWFIMPLKDSVLSLLWDERRAVLWLPKGAVPTSISLQVPYIDYDTLTKSPKKQVSLYFFLFICCSTKDLFQNWRLWSRVLFSIFSWHIDLGSNLGNISFMCQIYFSIWKVTQQLFIKSVAFKTGNRARVSCINISGPF